MTRKLRVGVLLDGLTVPYWLERALRRVLDGGRASVELVALREPRTGPGADPPGPAARLLSSAWRMLAERHRLLPDAFAPTDTAELWSGTAVVRGEDGLRSLAAARLDVIVKIGAGPLPGAAALGTLHGVWTYAAATAESLPRTDEWQAWQETGEDFPVLKNLVDGSTLCSSNSADPDTGLIQNRNAAYLKASSMLGRTLELLADHGPECLRGRASLCALLPRYSAGRSSAQPSAAAILGALTRLTYTRFANKVSSWLFFNQWRLAYGFGTELRTDLGSFAELVPPKDRFWADPFVLRRDGRYYIFVEELLYAKRKAHIALIVMDEHGNCAPPVTLIDEPHHLSYPFVLEHGGELYLVPEAHASRTLPVYRCVRFPYEWQRATTLFDDIDAVDPTLLHHDGRWWLFMNVIETAGGSSYDDLFLYSSDEPLGRQWTPHPMNPIVSDIASARPAGRIFAHDGRLYRPSQDSGRRYGYQLKLNRIVELTQSSYREEIVSTLSPDWHPAVRAVHTFSRADGLTLVDAQYRRARYW